MRCAALVTLLCGLSAAVSAQQWPQFRGPQAGVAADHSSLPDTWSETENLLWRIDIPGRGWSSPVVWGDHVFVTTSITVSRPTESFLAPDAYRGRGTGGTMTRDDVNRERAEQRWTLYDIDRRTGAIRWQRELRTAVPAQSVHQKNSYGSETPVTDGERVYVYLGYAGLFALDFTGNVVWSRLMDALETGMGGWGSAKGEETSNAFVAWSQPRLASCYPSPMVVGDQYYTLMDGGFLTSNDARTGREIYGRQRLAVDAGTFSSSPWSYNGKIFAISEDGETFVIQAGREFKLLGRNKLNELTLATPAVAGDTLLIRTATKLYAFSRR